MRGTLVFAVTAAGSGVILYLAGLEPALSFAAGAGAVATVVYVAVSRTWWRWKRV